MDRPGPGRGWTLGKGPDHFGGGVCRQHDGGPVKKRKTSTSPPSPTTGPAVKVLLAQLAACCSKRPQPGRVTYQVSSLCLSSHKKAQLVFFYSLLWSRVGFCVFFSPVRYIKMIKSMY